MPKRQAGVGFILITLFIDILGFGLVIPIVPKLVAQLSHSTMDDAARYYGWLLSLYGLMQFFFAPIFGSLSDRVGRRPVLLLSLFANGLDYVVLSWAPTLPWLFLGRIVSGITGASFTTGSAYIADVTPPEKRAQSFGLVGAAFGVGFIIGPVVGGILGEISPRAPFIAAAVLSLANWLYGMFVLPESLAPENRRPFSLAKANPVGSLGLLRRVPVVVALTATMVCSNLAQQSLQGTWVLYGLERFHWSNMQCGASLAVVGLATAIVQAGLMRRLVPAFGERKLLVIGLVVNIISFTLFGLVTVSWLMYLVILFWGLSAVANPSAQALITRRYGPSEQGAVQGALTSLFSLTGIFAPLMATSLFAYFVSKRAPIYLPGVAFFWGAFITLIGVAIALRAFRLLPDEPRVTQPSAPEQTSSDAASQTLVEQLDQTVPAGVEGQQR